MNTFIKTSLAVLSLTSLTACVPAASQDVAALQAQVQNQNQTIQSLNSQLSGVQPAQADTWSQLQALRQEMASMRGILDNIELALRPVGGAQYLAEKLAKQDRALTMIGASLGLELQLDDPIQIEGATSQTPQNNQAQGTNSLPMTISPSATNVPSTAPTTPAPAVSTTPAPVNPTPVSTNSNASMDTAQALYDAGMKSFNEQRYQQAANAFTDFVNTYSSNSLVSNAYYWQGESYYQLKNYAAAALAYENVISKYSKSNRAPSAYLKQGMSFAALGKNDAAKERYNQLIKAYPKAPEATRAQQLVSEL